MAKENKQKDEKTGLSLLNATTESVEEQIKNANKFSKEILSLADEMKDKEEKEKKARELNQIRDKATFINLLTLLKSRFADKQDKAISKLLKKSKELLESVVNGLMTPNEYETALEEQIQACNKEIQDRRTEYNKNVGELRNQFPNGDWWAWTSPFRKLDTSGAN